MTPEQRRAEYEKLKAAKRQLEGNENVKKLVLIVLLMTASTSSTSR